LPQLYPVDAALPAGRSGNRTQASRIASALPAIATCIRIKI